MKSVYIIGIGIVIIVVAALIALVVPSLMSPQSTTTPTTLPEKEYKLSVVVGPQSPWGQAAQMFADEVYNRTNGRIKIRVYFSGQLFAGQQTNEFQLLSQGVADFAIGSVINWAPVVKELNLFILPFFFPEGGSKGDIYKAVDAVVEGEAGRRILQILESYGVIGLAWGENGFRQLTNWKQPVTKPEDLAGLKIRVVGSPIFIDTFQALGADPTQMNWADALTAFQQRVVDGQENPINIVIIPYKLWEYHKYITIWNYAIDPLIFAVNKNTWESFDANTKQIILEAARKAARWQKAMARVGLDDGTALNILKNEFKYTPEITDPISYLQSKGMEVTFLSAEQREAFKQKMAGVYSKWVPTIGNELVQAAINDIRNKLGITVQIPTS
ncbi:MAG: DctP family TRAP transporter solute-binding subunit [Zestosphaera sp.]